jgi:hypothetical protein
MNKKTSKENHTVIMSDKYIAESGVQGGKVVGDHLALGSLIVGIPMLIMGLFALISMYFGFGFPTHTAGIIAALIVTAIGVLLVIGGCSIYKTKNVKK